MSQPTSIFLRVLLAAVYLAIYIFIGAVALFFAMIADLNHVSGPECCWVEHTHYVEFTWAAFLLIFPALFLAAHLWWPRTKKPKI